MNRLLKIKISGILLLVLLLPVVSWGSSVTGGPHLWLSTDPLEFDEGGIGYVGDVSDAWLNDSYVTYDNPLDLYIYYHKALNNNANFATNTATNIQLMVAIHKGEIGTGTESVTVAGTTYNSFTEILLPSQYGGGNHGIYNDPITNSHDGRYAIASLGFDLDPHEFRSVSISWTGFSEVHFDVFSSNAFYNSASHDATGVIPEPGTIMLLGSGLIGLGVFRKKFKKK